MIKNILFDLDDTLLDFHTAEKNALRKTLEYLGINPTAEILARYSQLNKEHWKLLEQGKLTRKEVKVGRYKQLFKEIGLNCCAESATGYYENLLGIGHYFIKDAEKLLEILSADYKLYIVSNGTAQVQKTRIESSGIEKYFKDIFISQLVGYDKPNIKFFDYCFMKIPNFKKCETVIVGDSLSSDIKGGKNAGIKTIWFNPKYYKNCSDIIPDYEISELLDLIGLLKTMALI